MVAKTRKRSWYVFCDTRDYCSCPAALCCATGGCREPLAQGLPFIPVVKTSSEESPRSPHWLRQPAGRPPAGPRHQNVALNEHVHNKRVRACTCTAAGHSALPNEIPSESPPPPCSSLPPPSCNLRSLFLTVMRCLNRMETSFRYYRDLCFAAVCNARVLPIASKSQLLHPSHYSLFLLGSRGGCLFLHACERSCERAFRAHGTCLHLPYMSSSSRTARAMARGEKEMKSSNRS